MTPLVSARPKPGVEPLIRRCYDCDVEPARYEAHLDHDFTPVVLLCEACARWERDGGSVEWIRTANGR